MGLFIDSTAVYMVSEIQVRFFTRPGMGQAIR